jgi:hypothetical protein
MKYETIVILQKHSYLSYHRFFTLLRAVTSKQPDRNADSTVSSALARSECGPSSALRWYFNSQFPRWKAKKENEQALPVFEFSVIFHGITRGTKHDADKTIYAMDLIMTITGTQSSPLEKVIVPATIMIPSDVLKDHKPMSISHISIDDNTFVLDEIGKQPGSVLHFTQNSLKLTVQLKSNSRR